MSVPPPDAAPLAPVADFDRLSLADQARVSDRFDEIARSLAVDPTRYVTPELLEGFEGPAREVLLHLVLLEEFDRRVEQVVADMTGRAGTVHDQATVETILSGRAYGPATAPLEPDLPQLRRYALEEEIGRGATAVVYSAFDRRRKARVAVKVLHQQLCEVASAVESFRREIRFLVELCGAAVPTVFDAGYAANGQPYVAMELVTGHGIRELLPRLGNGRFQFDPGQIRLAAQICRALAPIHARGISHLDISPDNIRVTPDGRVVLLDFGLGRDRQNAPNELLDGGSRDFIAPEKARRETRLYSPRTDVFSLGCLLLWQLTGRSLYPDTDDTNEKLRRVAAGELKEPLARLQTSIRQHGVPEKLAQLVKECLAVAPGARPVDAGAVADRLDGYFQGVEEERQTARVRATRLRWMLALLLVALVAAGGAWYLIGKTRGEQALRAAADAEKKFRDGEAAAERGRWQEARSIWRPLAADRGAGLSDGRRFEARLRLVRVAAFLGDLTEISEELGALGAHPFAADYRGRIEFERAIHHLEMANRETFSTPAKLLGDNPFDGSAVTLLRRVQDDPDVPPADRETAKGLLARTADEAVSHYKEALTIEPFHPYAGPYLLVTCLLAGRLPEAIARADAWGEATPDDPLPWFYKAFAHTLRGQTTEADAALGRLTRAAGGGRVIPLSTIRMCEGVVNAARIIPAGIYESAAAKNQFEAGLVHMKLVSELIRAAPADQDTALAVLFAVPLQPAQRRAFCRAYTAYSQLGSGRVADVASGLNLLADADEWVAGGTTQFARGLLCHRLGQVSEAEKAFLACCRSERQLWDVRGLCHLALAKRAIDLAQKNPRLKTGDRVRAKDHLRKACDFLRISPVVPKTIRELAARLGEAEFANEIDLLLAER